MNRIKVLQILAGAKEYNGVSDFLLSYYSHMNRENIQFDFLFCRENTMTSRINEEFLAESDFIELNDRISRSFTSVAKLIFDVRKTIEKKNYDIVHINTGSVLITWCCVIAAKKAKAPLIISHSHNTDPTLIRRINAVQRLFISAANRLMRPMIRTASSAMLACSEDAGEYLFGKRGIVSDKFCVMPNAIQTEEYLYNEALRKKLRDTYHIKADTVVLGCVGRFSEQKNHSFLVDVFDEYHKLNPDSVLWLVGDGKTRDRIEKKTKDLNINETVVFWGQRGDVNELLQAMDVFVLTSFFEGLGTVSIEAQAAGLPVFLPDEISHGSHISDLVTFIPLKSGPKVWAEQIHEQTKNPRVRRNMYTVIRESGYDISGSAAKLEKLYSNLKHEQSEK